MKNNSIIKINSQPSFVKTKPSAKGAKKHSFSEIDNDINQLWQMYQAQLHRNGELMTIIDRQQQFIQQVINKGVMASISPEPLQIPQEPQVIIPLPAFNELSVERLNELTNSFKKLFWLEVKRLDGMHAIINMLYTLHQMGGNSYPEQLFEKIKMGKSTGFRHSMFLRKNFLIKSVGGKYDARYKITVWGKKFLNGTLEKYYTSTQNSEKEEDKKAWAEFDNLNGDSDSTKSCN